VDYLLAELASKHVDVMLMPTGADLLFGIDGNLSSWVRSFGNKLIFSEKEKRSMLLFDGTTWNDFGTNYLAEISGLGWYSKSQTIEFGTRIKGSDVRGAERMMAAYELEVRYPFLDDKILNVAQFLTSSEKRGASLVKKLFNNQISNFGLATKTQRHQVPLAKWIRTDLYEPIKGLFEREVAEEFFNQKALIKILEQHRLGVRNFSRRIWAVAIFIIWLQEVKKI